MISICVLLRPASPLVHNAPFVPIINQSDSNWAYPIHIEWVEASHPSGLLESPEHLTKSDYRKRLQLSRFLLFSSKAIAFLFELSDANVQRLYLQSWKKGRLLSRYASTGPKQILVLQNHALCSFSDNFENWKEASWWCLLYSTVVCPFAVVVVL